MSIGRAVITTRLNLAVRSSKYDSAACVLSLWLVCGYRALGVICECTITGQDGYFISL